MTEPRPQVTVSYPAIPRPLTVAWHEVTTTEPAPAPLEGAGEVYVGEGPPSAEVVAGMELGDVYVDTISGDVFRLD